MACLDNYILVDGNCGTAVPTTGLFINTNLPGITLAKGANVAEDTATTGVQLLNQSVSNGIIKARQDLVGAMLGIVRFNSIISSGEFGSYDPDDFDDDNKYLAGSASSRGIKLELKNCCRLSTLFIKRVRIIGKGSASTLTVTDGITDTDYPFTLVPQVPTDVEINQQIESDLAFIRIADGSFEPLDTELNFSGSCGFCSNDCCDGQCNCTEGMNVWGFDGTNTNSQTYGLQATVHNQCDQEKFFCEISLVGSVPQLVLYASGIIFLTELLHTNRVNVYTIYRNERAEELKAEWIEYYNELKEQIVKQLPKYLTSIDSCCLECNASRYETNLP